MKLIPLTKGYNAIVDDEDYDSVAKYLWHYVKGYARRGDHIFYLQNFLIIAPQGFHVEHRDRNGLNNQRSNLRLATWTQNMANRKYPSLSGYKGVRMANWKWMARITVKGRMKYIGVYDTPELAAKAYDEAAMKYYGEFAALNFPVTEINK